MTEKEKGNATVNDVHIEHIVSGINRIEASIIELRTNFRDDIKELNNKFRDDIKILRNAGLFSITIAVTIIIGITGYVVTKTDKLEDKFDDLHHSVTDETNKLKKSIDKLIDPDPSSDIVPLADTATL